MVGEVWGEGVYGSGRCAGIRGVCGDVICNR